VPASYKKVLSQRSKARAVALQALYESDTSSHSVDEALGRLLGEAGLELDANSFARDLARGAMINLDGSNDLIHEYAPTWPVAQISAIDRGILRIAILEMVYMHSAPPRVVANEAVELAKMFGSESSARFVNGVLGSLIKDKGYLEEDNNRRDRG